jgi:hypothetical protein
MSQTASANASSQTGHWLLKQLSILAALLGGCAMSPEAKEQWAKVHDNPQTPYLMAINAVAKYVRPEHLENCKNQIESAQHTFGGPWRLTGPLQPSVKWTCMETSSFIAVNDGKQVAGYLAQAVAGSFKQVMGCVITLQNGKLAVEHRVPPTRVHIANMCRALP